MSIQVSGLQQRSRELIDKMSEAMAERHEIMSLVFLCTVAGESIFLLGPPGVGKSMVARRLKYAFKDGKSFEYLMNRFSTPDEIFGPVSISRLSKEDKFERITENYLPGASVVFLDEIWKAGPSIQNALLTVINEKLYRNGSQEVKVNLQGLISASNELPAKGQGLEALWDRFLVRYFVDRILDEDAFAEMITATIPSKATIDESLTISNTEIETWSTNIDAVIVPDEIIDVITIVRKYIARHNDTAVENGKNDDIIYVSDRRWRKIIRLLRTSAFLNERESVDLLDAFLISYCIWSTPDQIEEVKQWVGEAISKFGIGNKYKLSTVRKQIEQLRDDAEIGTQEEKTMMVKSPVIHDSRYYKINDFPKMYNLIKKDDFDVLSGTLVENPIYSSWGKHENYKVAKTGDAEVEIELDEVYQKFKLESKMMEKTIITTKKAEGEVRDHLIKRLGEINEYLDKTAQTLEDKKQQFAKGKKSNLFVSDTWSALIDSSLSNALKQIITQKLDLKELEQNYIQHTIA